MAPTFCRCWICDEPARPFFVRSIRDDTGRLARRRICRSCENRVDWDTDDDRQGPVYRVLRGLAG